jgi:phage terminase large subunit GpA-like protein
VWPTKRPTRRNKGSYRPTIIGVNSAKDTVRNRLSKEEAGPGYMHFPADRDINFFAQLTAERIVVKEASGHKYRVWELPAGKANEALDCRVYSYAALCALTHFGLRLNRAVEQVEEVLRGHAPAVDDAEGTDEDEAPRSDGPVVLTTASKKKRSIASRLA